MGDNYGVKKGRLDQALGLVLPGYVPSDEESSGGAPDVCAAMATTCVRIPEVFDPLRLVVFLLVPSWLVISTAFLFLSCPFLS